MNQLTVNVRSRQVTDALRDMRQQLRNMKPVFSAVGTALVKAADKRFDTKQGPNGKPWKPWAPSTAARRAREGKGTLMVYTGLMREGLHRKATPQGVVVGFKVPYYVYNAKTRPVLTYNRGMGEQDKADAMKAAIRAFKRAMRKQASAE